MKLIVAGGREYNLCSEEYAAIRDLKPTEIVSGGARGVDTCGETWAMEFGFPCKVFPAEWDKYGRGAGHIRNKEMAQYADAVALFPGGKGTDNMYREAFLAKIEIYDYRD
jgi:hypothetical protein